MPRSNEEFEYSLPGDEPLKHQWDDNVQRDWYRHQPESVQKKYGTDPAKAFDQHQKDMELNWMADSHDERPHCEACGPHDPADYKKPYSGDGMPGTSLRAYYSKKRTRALKKWAENKKK